jgi:hypothetical protein
VFINNSLAFSRVPGHFLFGELATYDFDYERGLVTSSYHARVSPQSSTIQGGQHWFSTRWRETNESPHVQAVIQHQFPTAEALEKAKSLLADELVAIKPGSRIAVILPKQFDASAAEAVRTCISKSFREKDWTLAANGEAADFILTCSTRPVLRQDVFYREAVGPGESVPRLEQTQRDYVGVEMKLTRPGEFKAVWAFESRLGPPNFVQLKAGETLEDALRYPPVTEFFMHPPIPQWLGKHPKGSAALVSFLGDNLEQPRLPEGSHK